MNFKTTYILFGVLGIMVVVLGLAVWLAPDNPPDNSLLFPSAHETGSKIEGKDVERVEIDRGGEGLVFVRTGENAWKMEKPAAYRVNTAAVDDLIRQVLDAQRQKFEEADKKPKNLGLEPPTTAVTLHAKGRTLKLSLGKGSSVGVYALSSDQPKHPAVVLRSDLDGVFKPVSEFRARELLAASDADIGYLKVGGRGHPNPIILQSTDGATWNFVQPPYGAADYNGDVGGPPGKGPTGVRDIVTALSQISVEEKRPLPGEKDKKPDSGFVEDNAKDLKKYGLESAKDADLVLEVKRTPSDKESTTLLIGKKADEQGEQFYARLASDRNVVKVSAKALETIRKFLDNPSEVRDRNLVAMTDKPDLVRVVFPPSLEAKEAVVMELRRLKANVPDDAVHGSVGGDSWKLYLGEGSAAKDKDGKQGLETDERTVRNFVSSLLGRQVRDFIAPGKSDVDLGLAKPHATVTLVKGDKALARLTFGWPDDVKKTVVVRRETGKDLKERGEVTVPQGLLELAKKRPPEYLARSIKPAEDFADATKLELFRDGKKDVLGRKKGATTWTFEEPKELAGRNADAGKVQIDVLSQIQTPSIQRWHALKLSEVDPKALGLAAPKLSATAIIITEKDKKPVTKTIALLIGDETPEKDGYYARRTDSEAVFVTGRTTVDALKTKLLDMTVFRFDVNKVKAVKLSGWPKIGKRFGKDTYTLTLEKKGDVWEGKNPATKLETLNTDNLQALLQEMSRLKATRFVVHKTGPKPEHKIDPKQDGLEIEVTVEGEKQPVKLTLGKAEGAEVYAISSTLPGDVFVCPRGVLAKVQADPDHLEDKAKKFE